MKKYTLTDSESVSASRHRLAPGKFIHNPKNSKAMHRLVQDCCCDTPLLAAMVSPFSSANGKLYQITCWNVAVDPKAGGQAYTVIKEVTPVPQVSVEQKLQFAMLVMRELYTDRDFQKWIDFWVTDANRSAEAAAKARKLLEKETKVSDQLETLAAWGEAGGNDTKMMKNTNELVERALHLTRAAEKHAADPNDSSIAIETALALSGIAGSGKPANLADLAEHVAGPHEIPEAADAA